MRLNPKAFHMRRIVVCENPVWAPIERIDQCVASVGVERNVRSITARPDRRRWSPARLDWARREGLRRGP